MGMFTVMWVLLIYMLITTAMIPMFGRLADMYGRKNLYVLGFAVFTIGSLMCVFASPSYQGYDLIGFRIVQAMGGALMMANGTPMVADAFKANRLGLGLGINGIAAGAGLVLGPVVGGNISPIWLGMDIPLQCPSGNFRDHLGMETAKGAGQPAQESWHGLDWVCHLHGRYDITPPGHIVIRLPDGP